MRVRRAETKDIPKILDLLTQVCMVHHRGRPDIFKPDSQKYHAGELEILIGDFRGEITFPDERAVQWVEFSKEVDANAMEITIRDVYAGTSWQDTCIAAVDVYGSYAGMQ